MLCCCKMMYQHRQAMYNVPVLRITLFLIFFPQPPPASFKPYQACFKAQETKEMRVFPLGKTKKPKGNYRKSVQNVKK